MAPHIDLLSPSSFAGDQPHDQYEWLRENAPVHFHPEPDGRGFWAVTRHRDVKAVGRDTATFSSSPTIMLHDPSDNEGGALGDHAMMLMTDPPVHTRMRRLVARDFNPKQSAAMTQRIEELATQIVDAVIERGECDLVTDLAGEMPSFVIAEMLGIPLDDGRQLYHHTEALHSSEEAVGADARAEAFGNMFTYSQEVYAQKRSSPGDDLATMLAHAEIDGVEIDAVDFFLWFLLLVDAGGDTTRNLVGGGMWALFQNPAELARLRADPVGLMPTAIEELLRWVTPVIHMRRTATRSAEIAGQAIAEGDKVVMF
ncbi:MAG: cytochrome P450 [Candidatus Poriferisodalaceae bacterium]|jgi:cytochrome P450